MLVCLCVGNPQPLIFSNFWFYFLGHCLYVAISGLCFFSSVNNLFASSVWCDSVRWKSLCLHSLCHIGFDFLYVKFLLHMDLSLSSRPWLSASHNLVLWSCILVFPLSYHFIFPPYLKSWASPSFTSGTLFSEWSHFFDILVDSLSTQATTMCILDFLG